MHKQKVINFKFISIIIDALQKTVNTYKKLNILVNNAGCLTEKDWMRTLDVNLVILNRPQISINLVYRFKWFFFPINFRKPQLIFQKWLYLFFNSKMAVLQLSILVQQEVDIFLFLENDFFKHWFFLPRTFSYGWKSSLLRFKIRCCWIFQIDCSNLQYTTKL